MDPYLETSRWFHGFHNSLIVYLDHVSAHCFGWPGAAIPPHHTGTSLMVLKPRLSVRKLMIWIGVIASLLAMLRTPYTYVVAQARFSSRFRQGFALIQSYGGVSRPLGVSAANWDDAVGSVQTAWANVVFSPFQFPDENSLGRIVDQMQSLAHGRRPPRPKLTFTLSSICSRTPGPKSAWAICPLDGRA